MGALKQAHSNGSTNLVPPRRNNVLTEGLMDKELIKRHITIHDLAKVARKRKVESGFQRGDRSRINVYQEKILPHSTLSRESQLSQGGRDRTQSDFGLLKPAPKVNQKRRSTIDNPMDRRALSRLSRVSDSSRVSSACTMTSNKALLTEFSRIDRLARQRRNAVSYEKGKQIHIPKFNNGGPDNLMQQLEINSWTRQMKAYVDSGTMTSTRAKEVLSCRYLRLSKSNLEHLRRVLDETGEGHLVDESTHAIELI